MKANANDCIAPFLPEIERLAFNSSCIGSQNWQANSSPRRIYIFEYTGSYAEDARTTRNSKAVMRTRVVQCQDADKRSDHLCLQQEIQKGRSRGSRSRRIVGRLRSQLTLNYD